MLKILLAQAYDKITYESFVENLNPFKETKIDNVFDFIKLLVNVGVRMLGLVSIIFVIYGGYMYVTSAGNQEGAKKGATTLIWAIVGLVVSLSASLLVDFVFQSLKVS